MFSERLGPMDKDSLSKAGKTLKALVDVDIYEERYTQAGQDVGTYRQQRIEDTENASNTHFNNECHGLETPRANRL